MAEKGMSRRKHALAPCEVCKGKKNHMKHTSHWEGQTSLELTSGQNIPGEDQIWTHTLRGGTVKCNPSSRSNKPEFCSSKHNQLCHRVWGHGKREFTVTLMLSFQSKQIWNSACDSFQVSMGRSRWHFKEDLLAGLKVRQGATIKVPLCLYRRETSYVGATGEVQFVYYLSIWWKCWSLSQKKKLHVHKNISF